GLVCPELVAQDPLEELAAVGARECVADLVAPWLLVATDALVDEALELLERDRLTLLRLDDRVDRLAPLVVGDADHRGIEDLRVRVEHRLDLRRVDVDPTG